MPRIVEFAALERALSSLGIRDPQRVLGGWQSLAVYDARLDGRHVAVKVLDPELIDRNALEARLDVLSRLDISTDVVCAPVPVGDGLLNEVAVGADGAVYAVVYEFAEGDAPDIDDQEHVAQMGRVLAELHMGMAALPPIDLPALAAFPATSDLSKIADQLGVPTAWLSETSPDGPRQLLHGDLSTKNVRVDGARWQVFDFDDCGYGPVELDLANSLYYALFDALTGADPDRHRHFRESFLGGYQDRSGIAPTGSVLDGLITRRVLVLASWLAEPNTAPPGIRTASDEWRTTLEGFVRRYLGTVDRHLWG